MDMQNITVGELANRAAESWGDRELLCYKGRRATFAESQLEIDRIARGLIGLGVEPGDKVSLWMTNCPEWVHVMFAVAKIGAVMVPINTRFRTVDLDYVVRQSDTSTIVTLDRSGPIAYLDMVIEACPELRSQEKSELKCEAFPLLKRVISLGEQRASGVYTWEEMADAGDEIGADRLKEREAGVKPADTLFIMYTSGTTGFPKGVMHCHNVIRNARVTADAIGIGQDDCTIMYLPLFHAFGYFEGPLMSYATGCRMVLTETFDPGEVLELIERERGSIIHGFDTHWQDLLDHADFEKRDLRSLKSGILAAGLPSTVRVAERANEKMCRTCSGWGMTEVMPGALIGRPDDTIEHATRTSGAPGEGYEIKIADSASGETLGPGKPGEICVRGFAVMQGYYKKPEETAKTIDAEGWLHSGDMGVAGEDGYVRFLGRYKEMLKIGGENVDPVEVEAYYISHPGVNKFQVVGVPDRRLSEIAVAFVVLEPGQKLSADELDAYAKGKLASFKIPSRYFFIEEYPMTPSGKVKKFELRRIAREELGIEAPDIEQGVAEKPQEAVRAS